VIILDTNVISELAKPRAEPVVATRNTRDFEGCGVKLIDPWRAI
jgi:predicted nucleic acid-binding protein